MTRTRLCWSNFWNLFCKVLRGDLICPEIDRKLQGFILQGLFVGTGLKVFFAICEAFRCNGKVFSCNLVRASAVRRGGESGGSKQGE